MYDKVVVSYTGGRKERGQTVCLRGTVLGIGAVDETVFATSPEPRTLRMFEGLSRGTVLGRVAVV